MASPLHRPWGARPAPSASATLLVSAIVLLVAIPGAAWSGTHAVHVLLTDPVLAILAALLATATTVPYAALLLWFDRHEQEPFWLLTASFLWGATAATGVALVLNDAVTALGELATGDHDTAVRFTIVFAAPLVEESLKATALVVLLAWFREHLDGVLDGVVYGTLVGLGFAWFENVLYYVAAGTEGPTAMLGLAWVRGVVSGVGSHATFTGLTGVGVGLARIARDRWVRVAAPAVGFAAAIVAHVVWNVYSGEILDAFGGGPATLLVGAPLAAILLQAPFLSILLVVMGLTWRH
ncbi:MAG: PrsW family intramembrane metalloprotease, partial [Myxococcales bacterium]|nr:PrsW family intramembrane metalloprotease [Myxococcales bacterium]